MTHPKRRVGAMVAVVFVVAMVVAGAGRDWGRLIGGEDALAVPDHCQVTDPRAGWTKVMFLGGTGGVTGQGSSDSHPPPGFQWSATGESGGTFEVPQGSDGSHVLFHPAGKGTDSMFLRYGTANDTGGSIVVWQGDLGVDGLNPPEYTNPGLYLQIGGPRHRIRIINNFDGADHKSITLHLNHLVEVWSAEEGGELLYDPESQYDSLTWQDGYGLNNWDDLPEEVWLQAVTPNHLAPITAEFSGRYQTHNPDFQYPTATRTVTINLTCVDAGLKSVTFSAAEGGGYYPVCVDATGAAYGTPQWEDNSDLANGHLDGDAEDWEDNPADQQYPVCYVRGSTLKVTVVFVADPDSESEDATIEGEGPDGMHFGPEAVEFATGGGMAYGSASMESSQPLTGNKVDWYPHLEIKWTLRSAGRELVGTSDNEMFVTLAAPQCDTLYRTVAYLACSNTGATDADVALAHTWNMFSSGDGPANVCGWNDQSRWYDRRLYYWHVANTTESTTAQLLSDANGNCDAWAHIFHDALLANGATVDPVVVLPMNYVPNHPEYTRIVVKNVSWDDSNPEFPGDDPWKYGDGDIDKTPPGLPGQNMPTPAEKIFWWHHVTLITQDPNTHTYYDPSYGITATDEADFTGKAIAGWGLVIGGAMHYRKISAGDEVSFVTIAW